MKNYRVQGNFIDRIYNTLVPFAANTAQNFKLDITSIVSELQFRLTGTLTHASYSTAPVKRVESIENLISQLRIIGNGAVTGAQSDTFNATDAAFLAYKTRIMETTAPTRVDVGVANAAYNFVSSFKHYFGAKRAGSSSFYQSCFLDSRNLSNFNLAVQWRDLNALVDLTSAVGGTTTLTNVGMTVLSREYQGGPPTKNNPYVKQSQRQFDLTNLGGLNKPFKDAPVGGWMPRQTFKAMIGDVDYGDPSDAVIATTLKAEGAHIQTQQNGNYLWNDSTYAHARDLAKTLYGLETIPTGYATVEYPGGLNLVNTANAPQKTLANILDLTYTGGSTNTLQITDELVIF